MREYLEKIYTKIGDTKIIEDSNKVAREVERRGQQPNVASTLKVYHILRAPVENPISRRGHVQGVVKGVGITPAIS